MNYNGAIMNIEVRKAVLYADIYKYKQFGIWKLLLYEIIHKG